MSKKLKPVIICGVKNSGKTAYLSLLSERMKNRNIEVGGFLSVAKMRNGIKQLYLLNDISSGEKALLASRKPQFTGFVCCGAYYFDPLVFKRAVEKIKSSISAAVIILDEYGPLEKNGGGFRPALNFLLKYYEGILIISTRPSVLSHLVQIIKTGRIV